MSGPKQPENAHGGCTVIRWVQSQTDSAREDCQANEAFSYTRQPAACQYLATPCRAGLLLSQGRRMGSSPGSAINTRDITDSWHCEDGLMSEGGSVLAIESGARQSFLFGV